MHKIYTFFLFFLTTLLLQHLCIFTAEARWATYEDAPAEMEFYNSDTVIDKDGKSVELIEKQVKIRNEMGRNIFSAELIRFNENIEKIEIIEAKTIFQGKEHVVPKEMIEIKPLASEIHGFDQLFQILISYPHVGVGTQVYLKYKITMLKQPLPHYFASKYNYGGGAYWKKSKLKIKSALPFHIIVNDPDGQLEVNQSKDNKTLEVSLKKPSYNDLINESQNNQVPDNLKTWFYISTYEKFEDLSKALSPDYEKVTNEDLPPLQESIRKAAENICNSVDQINQVTSLLSEKIRYMGDWRTIEGKFTPRSLKAIETSGVGDCKDFAACTVAILKALGYKAQVALVMRGIAYLAPERTLPSFQNFNHAIVKAIAKDGKVFWIDPTNFTSMADGIYPDISDRPVLVLDAKNPSYEHIPSIDYQHSKITFTDTVEIKDNDVLSNRGSIEFSGEQAQGSTGAGLNHSLKAIEEAVIKQLTDEVTPLKQKITLPPLDSRIVKDFKIEYIYETENSLLLTNAGPGILIKDGWSQPFTDVSDCQKGTTFLGLPGTILKKLIITDVDAEQAGALTYEVKTPWVEAKRECQKVDQGVEITEKISLLKSFVTAEEVKSKQYNDLRRHIKKYCSKMAIIVTQKKDKQKANVPPSP